MTCPVKPSTSLFLSSCLHLCLCLFRHTHTYVSACLQQQQNGNRNMGCLIKPSTSPCSSSSFIPSSLRTRNQYFLPFWLRWHFDVIQTEIALCIQEGMMGRVHPPASFGPSKMSQHTQKAWKVVSSCFGKVSLMFNENLVFRSWQHGLRQSFWQPAPAPLAPAEATGATNLSSWPWCSRNPSLVQFWISLELLVTSWIKDDRTFWMTRQ